MLVKVKRKCCRLNGKSCLTFIQPVGTKMIDGDYIKEGNKDRYAGRI